MVCVVCCLSFVVCCGLCVVRCSLFWFRYFGLLVFVNALRFMFGVFVFDVRCLRCAVYCSLSDVRC